MFVTSTLNTVSKQLTTSQTQNIADHTDMHQNPDEQVPAIHHKSRRKQSLLLRSVLQLRRQHDAEHHCVLPTAATDASNAAANLPHSA